MMSSPAPEKETMEKPPQFPRRVQLKPGQFTAFLIMAVIPLMAVLRMLGDREQTLEARADGLTMSLEAPKLARYGNPVRVRLKVVTDRAGPGAAGRQMKIAIAERYLERFSDVSLRPAFQGSTSGDEVLVRGITEGQRELEVTIDLTPEKYGWAEGKARAGLDTGGSVELAWRTFVFP